MSVIIGYRKDNILILAGDKRACGSKGNTISDNTEKVFVINNHLAFSSAGNGIGKIIAEEINKEKNRDGMNIEDVIDYIQRFFKKLIDVDAKEILSRSTYFIIGGLNNVNQMKMYSGISKKGIVDFEEVPMILFPPQGMSINEAGQLLAKNLIDKPEMFIEQTIFDISERSIWVSHSGDKWIFDNRPKLSKFVSF